MGSAPPLHTRPGHVPSQRVMDINVYALPGAETDFLAAWKTVQDSAPSSIVWSPRNGGHWLATRGREIEAIYKDHEAFSSRIVLVPRAWGEAYQVKPSTLDPPQHTGYRRILSASLTSADVEAARPSIRAIAAECIAALQPLGRCEFIGDFAKHIPIAVFLALTGLPPEDAAKVPGYAEPILDQAGRVTDARVMDRYADYLRPLCRSRMANPGRDLISRIVNSRVEGRPLTEDDAVELTTTMMTGGLDTIVSSLGLLMAFLARSPEHRRQIAAEPERAGAAINEMLRRFPTMTKARLCTHERNLDCVTIKPGDMVVLPPLHGLDPHMSDAPMDVDFDRAPKLNLAFGAGVHRCPGALLAQTELEIVILEWLARIPDFAIDPHRPPKTQSGVLGAMLRLGLTWPV
jgi:cytochrome P450